MPAKALAAGRIRRMQKDGSRLLLELERNSNLEAFEILDPSEVAAYLIEGDLVALLPEGQILLLAPFSTSGLWPSFPLSRQQQWQQFVSAVRNFFQDRDFLEIQTPSLVICPGTEPSLDVFSTELKIGSRRESLYLPTSPELHLKKTLARGAEKIFEIARCYRNGEKTSRHLPEFLMLEWYRSYDNLSSIQNDVEKLVEKMIARFKVLGPHSVKRYSVSDLFRSYCDFDLKPDTTLHELKSLAQRLCVDISSAQSLDDYFFLIFTEKIEEKLPNDELIFVEKYPPYQAALARLTEDGWGDRFEVYWKGLELANAFHELNDPLVQRLRSKEDIQKKIEMGKEIVPLDEDFFRHLEAGMPPSAGIALGLERLFMALFDITDIEEMRIFQSF